MTAKTKTREIYDTTTGRARDLFDKTKVKLAEVNVERKRHDLFRELGEELYRQRTSGVEQREELDRIVGELQELEAKAVEAEGVEAGSEPMEEAAV